MQGKILPFFQKRKRFLANRWYYTLYQYTIQVGIVGVPLYDSVFKQYLVDIYLKNQNNLEQKLFYLELVSY